MICQQIFSILVLVIFLLKNPLKKCFKIVFFLFGAEIRFRAAISCTVVRKGLCVKASLCKGFCV